MIQFEEITNLGTMPGLTKEVDAKEIFVNTHDTIKITPIPIRTPSQK